MDTTFMTRTSSRTHSGRKTVTNVDAREAKSVEAFRKWNPFQYTPTNDLLPTTELKQQVHTDIAELFV